MTPDPIPAIRQRVEALRKAYTAGVSVQQSVEAIDAFDEHGPSDVETLLAFWDSQKQTLGRLVEQWREDAASHRMAIDRLALCHLDGQHYKELTHLHRTHAEVTRDHAEVLAAFLPPQAEP